MTPVACPCGGASTKKQPESHAPRFDDCCGRFLDGRERPANAMELMRSRYTAYVLNDTAYLRATWAVHTCPEDLKDNADAESKADAPRWLGLQIKRHAVVDRDHEVVEFVARYKIGGRAHRLHETSRFTRDNDGRWRYVDGDIHE